VSIVLVRNPYDRLLSAYLDKMVLQRKARLAPRGFEPGGSFESFLGNLTQLDPAHVDIHYRPMSLQVRVRDRVRVRVRVTLTLTLTLTLTCKP